MGLRGVCIYYYILYQLTCVDILDSVRYSSTELVSSGNSHNHLPSIDFLRGNSVPDMGDLKRLRVGLSLDEGLDHREIVFLQGRQSNKVATVSVKNILQSKTLFNKIVLH